MMKRQAQSGLCLEKLDRPDGRKITNQIVVGAEKDVLPVIDDIARFLIQIRITSAPQTRRLLEESDLSSPGRELDCRRESAQPAADDNCVEAGLAGRVRGFRFVAFGFRIAGAQCHIPSTRCLTQYLT